MREVLLLMISKVHLNRSPTSSSKERMTTAEWKNSASPVDFDNHGIICFISASPEFSDVERVLGNDIHDIIVQEFCNWSDQSGDAEKKNVIHFLTCLQQATHPEIKTSQNQLKRR